MLETCFIDLSSMERLGDLSKVHNLCLEPININSVLLAFNVNLFSISHSLTLARSRFKTSLIVSTQRAQLVRTSHRHREVMGSNFVEVLNFSDFSTQLQKLRS